MSSKEQKRVEDSKRKREERKSEERGKDIFTPSKKVLRSPEFKAKQTEAAMNTEKDGNSIEKSDLTNLTELMLTLVEDVKEIKQDLRKREEELKIN